MWRLTKTAGEEGSPRLDDTNLDDTHAHVYTTIHTSGQKADVALTVAYRGVEGLLRSWSVPLRSLENGRLADCHFTPMLLSQLRFSH